MSYEVILDSELIPGLPPTEILFPDHWKVYPGETKRAAKTWGDPTFNLVKFFPLLAAFPRDCPPDYWTQLEYAQNKWTDTLEERNPDGVNGIETIYFSRLILFRNPHGIRRRLDLIGTVAAVDPTRVWEMREVLNSVKLLSGLDISSIEGS